MQIDAGIAAFYDWKDPRMAWSVLLHFIGWAAGGIETYFMFRLAGAPVTLLDGLMLEALLQIARTASFFIPGNLGAQELGLALFAQWAGFSPSTGLAVSLFKRLRLVIWTAVGFMVWGWYERFGVLFSDQQESPARSKIQR